jgi:hypothetical protein
MEIEDLKPDFNIWGNAASWTLEEAASFIADIDPILFERYSQRLFIEQRSNIGGHIVYPDQISKALNNFRTFFDLAVRAMRAGELGPKNPLANEDSEVKPSETASWALKNGFSVPDELTAVLRKKEKAIQAVQSSSRIDDTHGDPLEGKTIVKPEKKPIPEKLKELYMADISKDLQMSQVAEAKPEARPVNLGKEAKVDIEDFVSKIRVVPVNDDEIKLQKSIGKRWISVNISSWGQKTPIDLIKYLEDSIFPPHYFSIGQGEKRIMDNSRKRLEQGINSKFLDLLKEKFLIYAPDGYKIYEYIKGEASWTYKFKFTVIDNEKQTSLDQLTPDALLDRISKTVENILAIRNDDTLSDLDAGIYEKNLMKRLSALWESAIKKGISEQDIREFLEPIGKEFNESKYENPDTMK